MTAPIFQRPQYRWVILGCCVLAYASSYLVRWSYTGLASFISEDLHLDKRDLGLMGAAFFFPYAFAQVPWGTLTDRIGGRHVIALGVVLSAVGLALFATSQGLGSAILWRMVVGVVAASAFVPIASLLAQWFETRERGMANGVYYGLGGGLGEGAAYVLLPAIQIYLLQDSLLPFSGWRAATGLMALLLAVVGLLCLVLLRSYPVRAPLEGQVNHLEPVPPLTQEKEQKNEVASPSALKDPVLWLLGGYFAAGIIVLRLVSGWLVIFAADVSWHTWGHDRENAVMMGGMIGLLYTLGHVAGSPVVGRFSDRLLGRGVNRIAIATLGLGVSGFMIGFLTLASLSPWILGSVALLLGITLHAFPVLNAVVAERWGIEKTGVSLGWINMMGQLAGAMALLVSGYVGMALSADINSPLSEFTGIWYLAMACCAVGTLCGWFAHRLST